MALLLRVAGRQCMLKQAAPLFQRSTAMASTAQDEMKQYWDRQFAKKRPLSPHLGIYKQDIVMASSATHRVSGIAMGAVVYGFGYAMLAAPQKFPYYMSMLNDLGLASPVAYAVKFVIAWPILYHSFNGIRHLSWDASIGVNLPMVKKTGYATWVLSFVFAFALAAISID